jgi:hypothetical protein
MPAQRGVGSSGRTVAKSVDTVENAGHERAAPVDTMVRSLLALDPGAIIRRALRDLWKTYDLFLENDRPSNNTGRSLLAYQQISGNYQ